MFGQSQSNWGSYIIVFSQLNVSDYIGASQAAFFDQNKRVFQLLRTAIAPPTPSVPYY